MKAAEEVTNEREPVGIVISRGRQDERPSVFSAYVWGPAPDEPAASNKPVAA